MPCTTLAGRTGLLPQPKVLSEGGLLGDCAATGRHGRMMGPSAQGTSTMKPACPWAGRGSGTRVPTARPAPPSLNGPVGATGGPPLDGLASEGQGGRRPHPPLHPQQQPPPPIGGRGRVALASPPCSCPPGRPRRRRPAAIQTAPPGRPRRGDGSLAVRRAMGGGDRGGRPLPLHPSSTAHF